MVPFQPEDYGAQGIVYIQKCVDAVVAGPNPRLRLLGYLLTKVARRSLHRTFETILRNFYGEDVFETMVMDATQYPEAVSHHLPIGLYKKKSKQAQTMRDLAAEVLERVEEAKRQPPRFLCMGNRNNPVQSQVSEPIRKVG
jgi:chromosome partitioning protein